MNLKRKHTTPLPAAAGLVIALALLLSPLPAAAIGYISIGVNTGLHPNMNSLMDENPMDVGRTSVSQPSDFITRTEFYNRLLATSTGKGEQFGNPTGIPFGLNFKYNINSILMRVSIEHSLLLFGNTASITPAGGSKDEISISSYTTMVPVTFGLSYYHAQSHRFYFGLGPVYAHSAVAVTHSRPAELKKVLPADKQGLAYHQFEVTSDGIGFHFLFGIETPITKKITVTTEWMIVEGQTDIAPALVKDTKNSKVREESLGQIINFSGHKFFVGVDYLIEL